MLVRDELGREITVGAKVLYGEDSPAEVIEISDPDVVYNPDTDADDGGYELKIVIRFDDDNSTETLRARYVGDDTFEESGDLSVCS